MKLPEDKGERIELIAVVMGVAGIALLAAQQTTIGGILFAAAVITAFIAFLYQYNS